MGYMCLFQPWFPQGICLGVGLLVHMVLLILVFKGIFIRSSIVAVSVYILTNSTTAFSFLHTFSSIYCLLTFWWWPFWQVWGDISLYFWFESIMSDVEDIMLSSNNEWYWASFPVFQPLVCLLWRNVCLGLFFHFLIGLFVFWNWVVWAACIFWKLILCQLFHMLLFSPSLGECLFTLLIVSFAVQKPLSLIRSHLFILFYFHYS